MTFLVPHTRTNRVLECDARCDSGVPFVRRGHSPVVVVVVVIVLHTFEYYAMMNIGNRKGCRILVRS